ncbi:MAG: NifB/NifX family molybdenum-iron cluster-binding protein [Campylobacterota bacterium]|nr:NifB/NifX family molybdenum-iron cluster-binding protein [Campylobacterota bacterium]
MVAVPIEKLGEDPSISNYFSKCKWFAIIDQEMISFEKNSLKDGCGLAQWLYDLGVTQLVLNHIGEHPLSKMFDLEIDCLCGKEKLINLTETLKEFENHKLIKIDHENKDLVIDYENGCKEAC